MLGDLLVVEQRQNNVGFPQGTILKRHRVPLPAPSDDRFYTYDQFNVGTEVSFYGRVYKLIDCDPFTRNFLTKLGVRVPPGKRWNETRWALAVMFALQVSRHRKIRFSSIDNR